MRSQLLTAIQQLVLLCEQKVVGRIDAEVYSTCGANKILGGYSSADRERYKVYC